MRAIARMICLAGLATALSVGPGTLAETSDVEIDADVTNVRQCLEAVRKVDSDARACVGVVAEPCLDQTADGDDAVACFERETALWDGLLDDRYREVVTHFDEEAMEQFRDVHDAWEDYRSQRCALGETIFEEGSAAARVWAADCLLQETGRRAIELGSMLEDFERR